MRQWWGWSMGPGKRRKAIGFGGPVILLLILLVALTPKQDEAIGDRFGLTPSPTFTATVGNATSDPTVTSTAAVAPSATPALEGAPAGAGREVAVVSRVVDGDTIVLSDDRRVRYIGIDTPETVDPGEPVQCYGPEASARNKALVEGQTVFLETDVNDTDIYDRLLRYVYLEDGRMVNEVLVAEGYAISKAYPPDTKYQERLDTAQREAKALGLGLWSACEQAAAPTATAVIEPPTQSPSAGASQCPQGCEVSVDGCVIKGNISSEHIYHVPGQRDYENTIIDPDQGRALVLHGGGGGGQRLAQGAALRD